MKIFEYKSIDCEVKDVDVKGRTVTGYFSAFNNKDSDGDIIMPGAYTKTLNENKSRIMHLWQHDVRYPLGRPSMLKEDNYGLYFESKIAGTSYGNDVLKLYEQGVINEHSVGFKTVKDTIKADYREINEIKLYEGSTVTFGANPNTPFLGMKGMGVEDLQDKMNNVLKIYKTGTFENEEIFLGLEIYFKQLQQLFIELTTQPAEAVEPERKDDELLKGLLLLKAKI